MPANYYETLKAQLDADAQAKKAALDAAYLRATQAQFDNTTGEISYAKDASGNPLYGTLDVSYLEQKRNIGAGAEASGMLNSGQYARNLATSQADYRSRVLGLKSGTEEQKTAIDTATALEKAKYGAMYGGGTSGVGTTPRVPGSTTPGRTPVTPVGAKPITPPQAPRFNPNKPIAPKETVKPRPPRGATRPVPRPAGSAARGGF